MSSLKAHRGGGRSSCVSSRCHPPVYHPWSLLCLVQGWKNAFAAMGNGQEDGAGRDFLEIKDKQRGDVCEIMIMWIP